jgi:D-alanine-D-alanine ligase
MKKNRRILMLVREGLVPPDTLEGCSEEDYDKWKMEYDIAATLKRMGHDVQVIGVFDDLGPIRKAIREQSPHIAFMLLEEFHGVVVYEHAVVSYLELMRQAYTGCNPLGLMLSKDKSLTKKILTFHHIPTPHFAVFPRGKVVRRGRRLRFPLIVKSTIEDASLGISQASVVHDDAALAEQVRLIHEDIGSDALAEEFVEGRELYVGMIGNRRLQTFPVWEMCFSGMPEEAIRIATAKVKWDVKYQKKYGIDTGAARDLPPGMDAKIARLCKRVYRALNMSGYARMDLRLRPDGRVYVLEANANPHLAYGEDFAEAAAAAGVAYDTLLQRILSLGLNYRPAWKG